MNTTIIDTDLPHISINVNIISVDQAREILNSLQFISAVGHQATAEFLTNLLGISIPSNRVAIKLKPNDKVVALKLEGRLPEGKVLTLEEMRDIPFKLFLMEVQA